MLLVLVALVGGCKMSTNEPIVLEFQVKNIVDFTKGLLVVLKIENRYLLWKLHNAKNCDKQNCFMTIGRNG
jgi:hypothetical protein